MAKNKEKKNKRKSRLRLTLSIIFVLAIGVGAVYSFNVFYHSQPLPPKETGQDGSDSGDTTQNKPSPPEEKELFEEYYGKAEEMLVGLTLEEKIGQLFLVRCPKENPIGRVTQYCFGGFVLFASDFEGLSAPEVKEKLAGFQAASKIPMIMAVDEEGGNVVRVSRNPQLASEAFKSPQQIYNEGGLEAVRRDAKNKSELLKQLGINLNLAPVTDVSTNPEDYIYKRTFGKTAAETADYVACVVEAMKAEGLSCTLKHFPGYGNNVNTHDQIAIDKRPLSEFVQSDFLPFTAGIEAGAQCVMVSHNIVLSIDERLPASLSPLVDDILINQLKFSGVVMTDDLSMQGVRLSVKNESPSLLALKAGNNMLVVSDFETAYSEVLAAVRDGEIETELIDRAVLKILAWKYSIGLFEQPS